MADFAGFRETFDTECVVVVTEQFAGSFGGFEQGLGEFDTGGDAKFLLFCLGDFGEAFDEVSCWCAGYWDSGFLVRVARCEGVQGIGDDGYGLGFWWFP